MSSVRPTLSDVALRAGVSRTTASFVMTGRRDMRISDEAQDRVLRAARELDYRPNLVARSLRTKMSSTIGFISDVIASDSFAGQSVRGSMSTALLHQHLLFLGETGGDLEVESLLVQSMLDRGVAGFVYASQYTRHATPSGALTGHPVVLMNCLPRGATLPAVVPDERGAGRAAASALLDAGHREGIWIVGETPRRVLAARERKRGINETFARAGVDLAGTVECLWWPGPAHQAVGELLGTGVRPKALICLNDRVAMGAYQAMTAAGLGIPGDVSVVSFDDSDLAGWLQPELSSVALPHFELGRRAVELLLAPEPTPAVHLVPMELRARDSVTAPRAAGRVAVRRARRTG